MVNLNLSRNFAPKMISYQKLLLNKQSTCESIEMLLLKSWKISSDNSMALLDIFFLPRVWKCSRWGPEMYWSWVGNAERWIIVLLNPESNKSLRSLVDGWVPMVFQVAIGHANDFGFSVADACCADTDAWKCSIQGKRRLSRWWHSFN